MNRKELSKLKKAIKGCKNKNDTLYIKGDEFLCRWNGLLFVWTVNICDGEKRDFNCNAKEVIQFIGDGNYITDYCYDYDN